MSLILYGRPPWVHLLDFHQVWTKFCRSVIAFALFAEQPPRALKNAVDLLST